MSVENKCIMVRLPRFIGDSIMIARTMAPLLNEGWELVAWGPSHVAELFEGSNYFCRVIKDPDHKPSAWEMAHILKTEKPFAMANLARSQRASLAAFLARVPLRLGWDEALGFVFNNRHLPFKKTQGHQMTRYKALLGLEWPVLREASSPHFSPSMEAIHEAQHLLGKHTKVVALALGAASMNKRIGLETWMDIVKQLHERDFTIVTLGSKGEDQALAASLIADMPKILDFTGKINLPIVAGIITNALCLIGNDSAMAHLAAACGIHTIVAFGPTDPAITAPPGNHVTIVSKTDLPCVPCRRSDCSVGGDPCMRSLKAKTFVKVMDEMTASASES